MTKKRILVTGAGGAASTNFIKSLKLSKDNYFIVGTDNNKFHLELSQADVNYFISSSDSPTFIKEINQIIEKERIDFVHPQPDTEVKVISDHRNQIKSKTFLPKKNTVDICQDKWLTYQKLYSSKTPVPLSFLIKTEKELNNASSILLKNHNKFWIRAKNGAGAKASLPADDIGLAVEWIKFWKRKDKTVQFIASEFLNGPEFAFQSLWKNGQIVVSQARERLEYLFGYLTASGQTSSPALAKTVSNDQVNEIATKAVLSVDQHATGIFCVDLKTNNEGAPCVTEINAGRFFTTSNFISEAGCNMPDIYIKMAFNTLKKVYPKYNAVVPNIYWLRMIDMGSKIIRNQHQTKIVVFDFDRTIAYLDIDWSKIRREIKAYLNEIGYGKDFQSIGKDLNNLYKNIEKNNNINIKEVRKKINGIIKKEELKKIDKSAMDTDFFLLLEKLKARNIKTAILSDNSEVIIKKIIGKNSIEKPDILIGRESCKFFKPETSGLELILKKSRLTRNDVLYVGDSKHDSSLAKDAGIKLILVSEFKGLRGYKHSNLIKEVAKYTDIK